MDSEWQIQEGVDWIPMPGFGRINPRQDNVDGGRQYFTARVDESDEHARATGDGITGGGPQTWYFDFDQPFLLADSNDRCVEVTISALVGARYAVRFRDGQWPNASDGPW